MNRAQLFLANDSLWGMQTCFLRDREVSRLRSGPASVRYSLNVVRQVFIRRGNAPFRGAVR